MADAGASYPPPAYTDKGGEQQPQQPQQQGYGFQPQQYGQYPPQQGQYPPQQGQYLAQAGYPAQGGYVHMGTTVAVTGQPTMMMVQSRANDYMGLSIFTLLCCCLPLGIAAIVSSCETQDANNAGDINRAQSASNRAKLLNYWALGLGIFFWVIGVILIILYFVLFASIWWG
ncbi:PREDICTED: protein SPEC3-like [Branchiostoma belcheri]|uniref:Protein SPEC3-like n=1 Tax=Branchiostoma belcheri TaxID=7741 RepID=A0A6P4Y8S3_BRABE|nr:PREDICTED: protein SPEC3-like [Branchiostoma belcheri]XP_019620883.1 PREDICTED: protein SPEC3-like [Branchiostoma belcheri]